MTLIFLFNIENCYRHTHTDAQTQLEAAIKPKLSTKLSCQLTASGVGYEHYQHFRAVAHAFMVISQGNHSALQLHVQKYYCAVNSVLRYIKEHQTYSCRLIRCCV